MVQVMTNRVDMNEGVRNKQMGSETELEGLRVKGLRDEKRRKPKLGTGLESKREGVEVRGERKPAHTDKEAESRERGRKKGVGSNNVIETKG